MPQICTNTKTVQVQGEGLCCKAVSTGRLGKNIGDSVQVSTASGRCGTCSVEASTRKGAQPGEKRLRFKFGGVGCPSKRTGCCALLS